MENKAKGSFISFLLGLLIGYWPLRWIGTILTFLAGYLCGDAFHFLNRLF